LLLVLTGRMLLGAGRAHELPPDMFILSLAQETKCS
jgi:hypothetical protein